MTTDNFCFYLQNRLIQTSQTGGQWYSDTSPFSIPWLGTLADWSKASVMKKKTYNIDSRTDPAVTTTLTDLIDQGPML